MSAPAGLPCPNGAMGGHGMGHGVSRCPTPDDTRAAWAGSSGERMGFLMPCSKFQQNNHLKLFSALLTYVKQQTSAENGDVLWFWLALAAKTCSTQPEPWCRAAQR